MKILPSLIGKKVAGRVYRSIGLSFLIGFLGDESIKRAKKPIKKVLVFGPRKRVLCFVGFWSR